MDGLLDRTESVARTAALMKICFPL